MHGEHEIRSCPEFLYELYGCSHRIKWWDLQNPRVAKIDDTLILIFLQERLKHGARLRTVLGEDVPFAHTLCTLAARERRLVERHMADKVKGVEIPADFLGQRV